MSRQVSKEELKVKRDWIVTEFHHERYTFDFSTLIYRDKTILYILDDLIYDGLENRIEKYENSNIYILDEVYHETPDVDEERMTEKERERFLPLHIGGLMIMPLEEFLEKGSEYMSACFGPTNKKFGVMDYAKIPVEMEREKNDIK